jgi:hypothetical protein
MIAQVDEQNAAVIADAVDPPGQADGLSDMGLSQIGAGMAAICVHFHSPGPGTALVAVMIGFAPIHMGRTAKSSRDRAASGETVYI